MRTILNFVANKKHSTRQIYDRFLNFNTMESSTCVPTTGQISLSEILELQDQPVSEEQAWALCYQLCSFFLTRNYLGEHGVSYGSSWKGLQLPGADGMLFSSDGNICLRIDVDDHLTVETEDQAVDYLGRLIYSCLDWGLETNVERELNETLELLVCQMTKVNVSQSVDDSFQPIRAFSEVIQVCEDRLYDPAQAAHHYRNICSTLFSETVELCHYLQNIQRSKEICFEEVHLASSLQAPEERRPNGPLRNRSVASKEMSMSLQKLIVETRMVAHVTTNSVCEWKHLVDELSRGVSLRPCKERFNVRAPLPEELSPFSQLMQDIKLRCYTLRKVQTVGNGHGRTDPHKALLEFIRSRPKLKPVSERKLKPKPKEEASLHERLMLEIRSTDKLKHLSSLKRRVDCKDNGCSTQSCLMPIYEDSSTEDTLSLLNSIPTPNLQEVLSDQGPCEDGVPSQDATFTDQDLKFFPVRSSLPMDPDFNISRGKHRRRSFASNRELCKPEKGRCKACVPMTIADVIKVCQSKTRDLKTMSCDRYRNLRVCCCCSKRSLFFTWHNFCSLCSGAMCPECCIEMRLPFKWCVNLPISFFKTIVLSKDGEQGWSHFWSERWSWDCSRVPLVLELRVPSSGPMHSLAMRDWHSQDVCVGCQGFLLEACSPCAPSQPPGKSDHSL